MSLRAPASGSATPRGARLWGVDAARGLALLGMMTVHVIPTTDPFSGEASWAGAVFSGRSAALFALLAGVGLSLLTGGTATDRSSARVNWDRKVIAVRAVFIIIIGSLVALLPTGVAIILVHYGLLFLLALPFLRLGARGLAVLAMTWVAVAPVAYWWLQNQLRPNPVDPPGRLWHSPTFLDLANPGLLGLDLFVTGYYPLLIWPAYLFAGMALGRLNLQRTAIALRLFLAGLAGAVATYAIGWLAVDRSDVIARMQSVTGEGVAAVEGSLETGGHFLPLVTDPMWFLIPMAHQGSTMDLLHTISSGIAVLGLCLLLARWLKWPLVPLVGAGAMPLSLYVGHLLVLAMWRPDGAPLEAVGDEALVLALVVAALAAGALKVLLRRRGPLEAFTHQMGTSFAGPRP